MAEGLLRSDPEAVDPACPLDHRSLLPPIATSAFSLFLDVDGTLLDIAARPDGVVVPGSLRDAIAALDRQSHGAIALVSGRTISDIDHLFAPLRLRASGVHGAEMRFDPHGAIHLSDQHLLQPTAIEVLRAIAGRYEGTLLEDKRFSVAIHYRATPASGPALREDLEGFLESAEGQGCRLLPGHMVFEVKRVGFDKGVAIATFQERVPFAGRQPIFIGDDVTDLPGFEQALAHGGLAYSVTTPRTGVSGHFPDPQSVRTWLAKMAVAAG